MKKLLTLSLLLISAGFAQAQGWAFDKSHSSILFAVDHMVVSEAQGKFKDFTAEVTGSADDFSDVKVKATIQVASIDTDEPKRDGHLKGADFFDAEKYPTITFESTSFKKVSGNVYEIPGRLTMRGVTKDVVLKAKMKGPVKSPWGGTIVGFTATGAINRQEFGVSWSKTAPAGELVVGDEVRLTINAEFVKHPAEKK